MNTGRQDGENVIEVLLKEMNIDEDNIKNEEDYIRVLKGLIKDRRVPDVSNLKGIFTYNIEDNDEY